MPDQTVAARYAKAFIDLGQEENLVERFAADLEGFSALLEADNGLHAALAHPAFPPAERMAALNEVLGKLELHQHSANFLRVVLEKRRFGMLPAITDAYVAATDELLGRVRARVITAAKLTPSMESTIQKALAAATGKTVLVDPQVDPSIIGGVIAHVEGRVFDASLRSRMLALRTRLLSTNPDQAIQA